MGQGIDLRFRHRNISGNVYAAGDLAGNLGNIKMGNATVLQNAVAKGAITPTPCGAGQRIQGTCSANANPGDPPSEAFPVWDWNPSSWTSAGFTAAIDDRGNCPKVYTDVAAMATTSVATAIITDCKIDWGAQNKWSFNADLAVVTTGGMSTSNL